MVEEDKEGFGLDWGSLWFEDLVGLLVVFDEGGSGEYLIDLVFCWGFILLLEGGVDFLYRLDFLKFWLGFLEFV